MSVIVNVPSAALNEDRGGFPGVQIEGHGLKQISQDSGGSLFTYKVGLMPNPDTA